MKLQWLLCITLSLVVHTAVILQLDKIKKDASATKVVPVAVLQTVLEEAQTQPEPQPIPTEAEPEPIAEDYTLRFRPNDDPKPEEIPQDSDIMEQALQEASQPEPVSDMPVPTKDEAPLPTEPPKPQKTPQEYRKDIKTYRQRLLAEFEEDWHKVPALSATISDTALVPRIDAHYGIIILGYGFVDQRPAAPFIIIDADGNGFTKQDEFDFSRFSNRVKDRMLYDTYQQQMSSAARKYNINSLTKIIGLVPVESDRYFASKQLRAIELAGVKAESVDVTVGHYEANEGGGFSLIIDQVVTRDGKAILVRDEEKQYSS